MDTEKHYLSQGKVEELRKESEELKTVKRREIAERLEFSKSLGDLSENAEYHSAREEQAVIEDRINEIESLLRSSEILADRKTTTVGVGSSLTIKRSDNKEEATYKIVSPEEIDVLSGHISYKSPLGSVLMNRKKGEEITVNTPQGEVSYSVIKVF